MDRSLKLTWALLVPLFLAAVGIVTLAITADSGRTLANELAVESLGLAVVLLMGLAAVLGMHSSRRDRRRLLRALSRHGFETGNIGNHVPNATLELLLRVCRNESSDAAGLLDVHSPREEPLTTDSLRQLLGDAGEKTPNARFNSEGGFSLN